jgi:predicted secreted protein
MKKLRLCDSKSLQNFGESSSLSQNEVKKMRFLLSCVVVILMSLSFASVSLAGDYAALNFIGFSKDARYLAFEEYGTQDGSGFPYSNIYFVNVEKNSFVGTPFKVVIESETATEATARNKAKLAASKKMTELKIVRGKTGTRVISRLITDLTTADTLNFAREIGSMYRRGDYNLTLKTAEIKTKECEVYELPTYKMELILKDNEINKTLTLQKDNTLPTSRGCALDYRVQDVYLYEGHIAVFLNVNTPGFEGPDMRFMVVTRKIE